MTTTYTYPQPGQSKPPPDDKPCADCNAGDLSDLACDAAGVLEQAEYLTAAEKTSKPRRDKFDAARALYVEARTKARADVKDIDNQVKHIKGQLDCLITDENRKQCLVEALKDVLERLAKCSGGTASGCCAPEKCDVAIPTDPKEFPGRWAEIMKQTVAAEACFDRLVKEPTEIPTRVADLKKRVAALAALVGGDASKLDLDQAYATVLVLAHDIEDVWRGFADVNAWYDCLCSALSCALKGHQALGELKHHMATQQCKQEKADEACRLLAVGIIDEVVAVCHRRCTPAT